MKLTLNQSVQDVPDDWIDGTLLSLIRDHFDLVGAKFGCGLGQCGACTVLVDGVPTRSCVTSPRDVEGRSVVTIEGLPGDPVGDRVTATWRDNAVAQCGYCQAGQIMTAVGLLKANPTPTEAEIEAAMDDTLCRCGTYARIRESIRQASGAAS